MLPRARRLQTAVWEALGLNNKNRALGLIFITIVATIWVVASFVVQDIEGLGVHPLILTYIANSLFAVFLPIHWIGVKVATAQREEEEERTQHARPEQPSAAAFELIASHHADRTRLQLVWSAAIVAPLWFLAQLTFNMSLQLTSVTSNTILSSTSALTTYIFSVLLLSERFTVWKMMFIIVLISGTAAVTLADSRESTPGSHEAVGDIFCMLSAVIYGLYTVALRWLLVDDKTTKMMLFFGYMGALIFCILGPMLLLAWWIGFDLGSLSLHALGLVVAKGVLDNVLSDYLWARAILLIGPTLASSGLSMQVPIAVALDAVFRKPHWLQSLGTGLLTLFGASAVLVGFFALTASSAKESENIKDGARGQTGAELNSGYAIVEADLPAVQDEEA